MHYVSADEAFSLSVSFSLDSLSRGIFDADRGRFRSKPVPVRGYKQGNDSLFGRFQTEVTGQYVGRGFWLYLMH